MVKVSKKAIQTFVKQTKFAPVSFTKLSAQFKAACSANGNGCLTKEQFASVAKLIFKTDQRELLDNVFEYLDLDDNGTLDSCELVCALNVFTKGTVNEKIEGCFVAFDLDSNGTLDRDEFNNMLQTTLCTSRDLLVDLLGYFAGNEDPNTAAKIKLKSLKTDEVEVLAAAAFDLADQNNDGVIELSEFKDWASGCENMVDFFQTFNLLFE